MNPRIATVCRYYPGNDYQLATGTVVTANAHLGVAHNNRLDRAHRVAWELLIGPISHGLHIDHLCRNRGCCNPDHLEPVTPRVNTMRGMAPTLIVARTGICQRGHSLDDAYVRPDTGARMCRPCMNARQRRHHNASA